MAGETIAIALDKSDWTALPDDDEFTVSFSPGFGLIMWRAAAAKPAASVNTGSVLRRSAHLTRRSGQRHYVRGSGMAFYTPDDRS